MVMGERGMADMGEMEMPLPDNTLPMMTGTGPVRPGRDGRHVHACSRCAATRSPATTRTRAGTSSRRAPQAYEWTGALAEPARFKSEGGQSMPAAGKPPAAEVRVRKPRATGH